MAGEFPRPLTAIKVSVGSIPAATGEIDRVVNPRHISAAMAGKLNTAPSFIDSDTFYGKAATVTLPDEFIHYMEVSKGITTIEEPIRIVTADASVVLEEPDPRWWGLIGSVVRLDFRYAFGAPVSPDTQKKAWHRLHLMIKVPAGGDFPRTIDNPHQITVNGNVRGWVAADTQAEATAAAAETGATATARAKAYLALNYALDEYYVGGTKIFPSVADLDV